MLGVAFLPFASPVPHTLPVSLYLICTHDSLEEIRGRCVLVASAFPCAMLFTAVQCAAQLLVGGALAAGFRLTNKLLGSTSPKESVDRQARAARAKAGPTSASGVIDIEAKVLLFLPHASLSSRCGKTQGCSSTGILVMCKTAEPFRKGQSSCSPCAFTTQKARALAALHACTFSVLVHHQAKAKPVCSATCAHLAEWQASRTQIIEEEAREREDVASMNAEDLRKFDQELEARARQRDIDMGRRWKP